MARKKAKAKEPVKIRFKQLANGNKSIYLDIYQDGKRTYEFLKEYIVPENSPEATEQNNKIMQAVTAIKSQRIVDIANGKAGIVSTRDNNKILLMDWLKQCKETQIQNGKKIASTYNNTFKLLKAFSGDDFLLKDVNEQYCKNLYRFLLTHKSKKTGQPLAKSSIALYCTCLCTILSKAAKKGYIQSNPYDMLERSDKVKGQESTTEYQSIDELRKMANTPCKHEIIKRAYLFACFCGLRLSDIERLTWDNIVEVNGQYQIDMVMQKTQTPIYLPLSDEAMKWLPERDIKDDGKQPIFPLLSRVTINSELKKWARDAGIEEAKASRIHFHVSRGTFCTTMLTLGCDLYTVSKLVGHKTIAMTTRYAKVVDQKKVDAVNLLNDILK